jgi:hypothetical protein
LGEFKIISEEEEEEIEQGAFVTFLRRVEYIYRIYFLPIFYRTCSILFIVFSFILMWSELMPIFKFILEFIGLDGRWLSFFYISTILFSQTRIINQVI